MGTFKQNLNMQMLDQFVHPAPKAGWIVILVAVLNWTVPGGSIMLNHYQAEGGVHWPTLGVGLCCEILSVLYWNSAGSSSTCPSSSSSASGSSASTTATSLCRRASDQRLTSDEKFDLNTQD